MLHRFGTTTYALVAMLSILLPKLAIAQARIVKVLANDGQPVVYANVAIEGATTRITDEKGEVSLGVGNRQTLTARVTRIGFAPWFGRLELPDTATVLTVTLRRLAQNLSSVNVTTTATIKSPLQLSGFYDRWMMRQKGALSAVFIGPEEIEFRHPDKISNMLYGLNGVQVKYGAAYSTVPTGIPPKLCPMAILIDGKQQYPTIGVTTIDQLVNASDVMAIEVYARGGNMPITLQANDTICGVIAFWTGSRR